VPMLEGKVDHVIGVDTHRDRHAAAILDRNGGVVAELEIESDQAERALAAHQEARQLGTELRTVVQALAPVLLAQPGVGPVTAAQLLIS
jgi:hypothetical protein